ncbi:Conserved_hypothetical protein [Hexamita inflata]|uniref:Uncharacterized protein n=1 Tax=Hexamita inflata TaxID=28002 RepID=A0AA86NRR9_9EUKA|nr:Conserved hypothetical protein [Hexamita inflata]
MQFVNHVIRNEEELLNHFGSQKLEIGNLQQMEDLLEKEESSNRNLVSISQEFVQRTKEFTFNYGQIKKIYFISFLTNLTELNLSYNQLSDISCISKLKNLKKLILINNHIEDISALQSLLNLTYLNIFEINLTSYTLALPNLVEFSLSGNKLQDISGLQHSPKLEILRVYETQITDLQAISQLFGLKVLQLSKNITQISHISNFVDLQILCLCENKQLQNIGPLKFCTQLTQLTIDETNVADIWPLQFMNNLQTFFMNQTQVIDLHPLQYLYQLEDIYANRTCIIDVSPLSKLTQLNSLDFSFSKITNAETLKHHKIILTSQNCKFQNQIKINSFKILSLLNFALN